MREFCHRCGGELSDDPSPATGGRSPFCPHCGAPQLLLSDYTEPLSTGAELPAGASTGTLPPPRPNQIDWRVAISIAAIVAAVGAGLSLLAARLPNTSALSTIWVISASLTTLAMYQRKRPLATMNAGVGAKIGVVVGLAMLFFLGAALSVGMAVARYKLHSMSGFDADVAKTLKMQIDQLAATRPVPPDSLELINSPEFRAAMMLTGFGIALGGVFLISVFGGAVGGLLRTRRFSPKA
jgi:ABC-type antimicrobial peptide transport system permease subunit